MLKISQNKKIAISAVALFIVSFSTMLFFLDGEGINPAHLQTAAVENETAGEKHRAVEAKENKIENARKDMGFVTDLEGVIKRVDPGFCKLTEEDCETLVGKKFFDLVSKDDVGELAAIYVKLGSEGKRMDAIGPIRLIDGDKIKLVLFSAVPVKNEVGKVVKIRFSAKDITEKVEALKENVNKEDTEKDIEKTWMERIYPKIKDLDEQGSKLLVKISYKKEEN